GREAIEKVQSLKPDLIFMDLQMPGINGFEVVKALQGDDMPMVIFATAYDQFAIQAFDLHAVDYIQKPFEKSRVDRAIDRAIERHSSLTEQNPKTTILGAIDDIARQLDGTLNYHFDEEHAPVGKRKLALNIDGATRFIEFADIDWVDAAGDYMCVHSAGEVHIVRSTLKELLNRLDDPAFQQIHRSTIVNIQRIVKIESLPKGERQLTLESNDKLKVSRNFKDAVDMLRTQANR
ncbi:MAG: LytTR family DNA-binding domain-containing protein, partial [Pseudomonadales bacterium]